MIYEPAEDSFLIQKWVKHFAKGKILDMGTGSGILALEALKYSKDVLAVDINPEAVKIAREKGIKAVVSDLFANVKGKFDLIIFNPPYLPEEKGEDKESRTVTTGGKKGYEVIERFFSEATNHIPKNEVILLVFSTLTGNIPRIAKKYGFKCKVLEEKPLFFEKLKVCTLTKKNYK